MLVMLERLYLFSFLDTKARTLLLTPLFPCVCVSILTQRSIYEAFSFSGYGMDPRDTDSNGCVDYFGLLFCGCLLFYFVSTISLVISLPS
jgi:hypothetical protein